MSLNVAELLAIYRRWPLAYREKAKAFFDALDEDGNGTISKSELRSAMLGDGDSSLGDKDFDSLWKMLDANGDGSLDFHECVAFFMLSVYGANVSTCDSCHKHLVLDKTLFINRASCKRYVTMAAAGEEPDGSLWHCLCEECYNYEPPSSWVFKKCDKAKAFWESVNQTDTPCEKWTAVTTRTDWARCDICKQDHTPNATSYLKVPGNSHMHRLPDGRMACEFCCWSLCFKCGDEINFFSDPQSGIWSRQTCYCAKKCKTVKAKQIWHYNKEVIVGRADDPDAIHCYTCQLNLVKGKVPGLQDPEQQQQQQQAHSKARAKAEDPSKFPKMVEHFAAGYEIGKIGAEVAVNAGCSIM